MTLPETRYAKSGEVRIAYQVVGQGPLDLVFVPGCISNLKNGKIAHQTVVQAWDE